MSRGYLSALTVGDLLSSRASFPLIDAPVDMHLDQVLQILSRHNLVGLPVYTSENGGKKYITFVNMIDIMTYIAFRSYDPAHPQSTAHFVKETNLKEPISTLVGISEEGTNLWTFKASDSLDKVLEYFSKGVHRALVESDQGTLSVITQTDIIKFLIRSKEKVSDIGNMTVTEGNLVSGQVVSISHNASALEGFRKMTIDGVSSIAIIGEDGEGLVGTLSSSDLRGITPMTLKNVLQPVLHYLRSVKRFDSDIHTPTAAIGPTTQIHMAMMKMEAARCHRLWVCEGVKPVGVVSMSDIICKFSPFDFKK